MRPSGELSGEVFRLYPKRSPFVSIQAPNSFGNSSCNQHVQRQKECGAGMRAKRVVRSVGSICLAVALGLGIVLAGSQGAFAADDCPVANSHCNVEAENNPFISWPRGFRSTFTNVTGTQAGVGRVGSIGLDNSPGWNVEYGWFWANGRNRAQIFRVTVFNYVALEVDLANIVGTANYTYEIRWWPAEPHIYPAFFAFTTYDSSGGVVTGSYNEVDNPPFSTGTPVTNGERHNLSDTWTGTLTFTNLLNLSATPAWSSWAAAMCAADNDPSYQNYTHPGPYVEVKTGGADC